ncbi:hypothetical protein OH76DRAFT_1459228 [Lentinus brumalis]|uniref:CCHC-type domain-containing protein n=1 Tax=Lentinus brumalis TaxID=2498619 RepID=A0A371CLZ0_9APHY|nr:hypothetical protein OH76DRAFT_1459228 [Polyporus brumalis]
MVVLNRLTGDAASWAGPYIITAATMTPWPDVAAFEDVFKVHFCAIDDKEAATAELVKLCKASTRFSVDDKRERYREGLPYCIKDEFATTAHDISTLVKMQTRPRTGKFPKCGEKVAANKGHPPTSRTSGPTGCFVCGRNGHRAAQCPERKGGQRAAASSSSSTTSDEVVALQLQLKALEERIATLMTMKEKEDF